MSRPVVGPTWSDVHGIAARVVIVSRSDCPPILKVRARNAQYEDSLTPETARQLLSQFEDLARALREIADS